jgi:hypothetical protein
MVLSYLSATYFVVNCLAFALAAGVNLLMSVIEKFGSSVSTHTRYFVGFMFKALQEEKIV